MNSSGTSSADWLSSDCLEEDKNMPSYEVLLDEVLRKDPAALVDAQKSAFEYLIAETGERYVLFGAGRLGQITLAGLRKAGIEPLAFADNNPILWGLKVGDLVVYSPQSAIEHFGVNSVFIITVYTSAPIWEQLSGKELKVASFAALAWQYPQSLTPHGCVEHPHKIFDQAEDVRKALSLWVDDTSRCEYLGQLLWRTSLDPSILPSHLPLNEIYFADDLIAPLKEEVFVDCGAFDGDSTQEFIKRRSGSFGQIIAIEPDPVNYRALEAQLSALPFEMVSRIQVVQSAVGSKREKVTFNATGTAASSIGEGSYEVHCAPLDEILEDFKPTFIKMDIEGAEPDALLGARKVIERNKPVLAICTYHAQEHLWQIPLMIQSFCDDYQFLFRRYSDECWELVCYAVPKSRLK
jgi:FkbM family methyltransferase